MRPITDSDAIWWKKIKYPVFEAARCLSHDGEKAKCPHCKHIGEPDKIAELWQAGFWEDVVVSLLQCWRCEKPFAVRLQFAKPPMAQSINALTLDNDSITIIAKVALNDEHDYEDTAPEGDDDELAN